MSLENFSFPNESVEYRRARDELLVEEVKLRQQIEAVAAKRRALPLGGELKEDYVFRSKNGDLRFSQLFADGKDTLLLYSMMYGSDDELPCPMCTSFVDGIAGNALDIRENVNLYVVTKASIEKLAALADKRGWKSLPLISCHDNTYNRDYHGESKDGSQWSAMNVFVKRDDGKIFHTWHSEMSYAATKDPGQDSRHIDIAWPLWNLLDLTPKGRDAKWYPSVWYQHDEKKNGNNDAGAVQTPTTKKTKRND